MQTVSLILKSLPGAIMSHEPDESGGKLSPQFHLPKITDEPINSSFISSFYRFINFKLLYYQFIMN